MVDIHTHVLPGVDDGSADLEMSLDMLEMSQASGVSVVVATPHCNIPGEFENYASAALKNNFGRLKAEAKRLGITVTLCYGMEVYTTPEVPELIRRKKIWTLNGSSYVLMEFAFNEDPDFTYDIIADIRRLGIKPVIAHPERYFFVQDDPQTAFNWCTSGCALQINKGSLLGSFGRGPEETARLIIEHGLAACVASDAHSPVQRTTHMGEVSRYLEIEYGEEYQRLLLEVNPKRILQNKDLYGYEPVPFY